VFPNTYGLFYLTRIGNLRQVGVSVLRQVKPAGGASRTRRSHSNDGQMSRTATTRSRTPRASAGIVFSGGGFRSRRVSLKLCSLVG